MIPFLFLFGVLLIPFNDVIGIPVLGEIKQEVSVYPFLLALGLFVIRLFDQAREENLFKKPGFKFLLKAMFAFCVVSFISLMANAVPIAEGSFRDRWAFAKYLTSNMMFLYGFGLAFLSYALGRAFDWRRFLLRPAAWSAFIVASFAVVEIASIFIGGPFSAVQKAIASVVHSGVGFSSQGGLLSYAKAWNDVRISSVCFEPPYLALFSGFLWPWVWFGYKTRGTANALFYGMALLAATFLVLVSNSRTAQLLFIGNVGVLFLLRFVFLPPMERRVDWAAAAGIALKASVVAFALFILFFSDTLASQLATGDFFEGERRVSNISRLASNMAAYKIFLDHPLFGSGMGQYGFHAGAYMPSWAWFSYEIREWFSDPNAVWPPVFNLYARLGAELGLLGLIFWIGLWYKAMSLVMRAAKTYWKERGALLDQAYPLIMSCSCVLISGFLMDSIRMPYIWITLGFLCAYVEKVSYALSVPAGSLSGFKDLTSPQGRTGGASGQEAFPFEAIKKEVTIRRRR